MIRALAKTEVPANHLGRRMRIGIANCENAGSIIPKTFKNSFKRRRRAARHVRQHMAGAPGNQNQITGAKNRMLAAFQRNVAFALYNQMEPCSAR